MLSRLRRFDLTDGRRHARLRDFAVALLDGDYPPVTHLLLIDENNQEAALPWEAVESVDWHQRQIKVGDLGHAQALSPESAHETVWLARDILDALIIDLENRRLTRANDLALEEEDGRLLLRAADASAMAILRRLSGGRYGRVSEAALSDWKYVEFLRGDPRAVSSGAGYHLRIRRLPPGEIAHLTEPLPYLHAAELITLLPDPEAADALEAMSAERQLQVFEELDEEQGLRLLALMAPDLAADLIGRLQTATMRRYLERLPKPQGERIIELLRYPEDSVGGLMTNEIVFAPARLTVAEARQALREPLRGPDFVSLVYIVEDEASRRLRGVISLRTLLTADDEQRLSEIMHPYVAVLHPLEPAREAAYRVINSHLAALPVVGSEGQLVGVVTVDAAVAQVAPASWRAQAPRIFS